MQRSRGAEEHGCRGAEENGKWKGENGIQSPISNLQFPFTQHAKSLFAAFAELLEYPWPERDLPANAQTCRALLAGDYPDAVNGLDAFVTFVEESPPARIEERYTGTFDLSPVVSPYVGYHLFGESYQRGALMARLKEIYAQHGFSAGLPVRGTQTGNELPDHLTVLLQFLAHCENEELATELVERCLKPALKRMEKVFEETENPYVHVIRSLRCVLESDAAA